MKRSLEQRQIMVEEHEREVRAPLESFLSVLCSYYTINIVTQVTSFPIAAPRARLTIGTLIGESVLSYSMPSAELMAAPPPTKHLDRTHLTARQGSL